MGCQRNEQGVLPAERLDTQSLGGWVVLRSCLDGCGTTRTHRYSIPGPSSPKRVVRLTALSRSYYSIGTGDKAAEGWNWNPTTF